MDILELNKRLGPLQREMDLRVSRNGLIASNVANVDTPGYKSKDIDFAQMLGQATADLELRRTDERHLPNGVGGAVGAVVESQTVGRPDGNNVQIEDEMLKLTQNNIEYNVLVQYVSKHLSSVRRTIDGVK